jgi:glycosyltransferase involved in cell wall biosynthesis
MLSKFSNSRVHIGCSVSDGISTAFLESLCTGAYPIQTNTSCASEWIKLGVIASVVDLNQELMLEQIFLALSDNELVDRASMQNLEIAKKYLDYKVVKKKALEFYK